MVLSDITIFMFPCSKENTITGLGIKQIIDNGYMAKQAVGMYNEHFF